MWISTYLEIYLKWYPSLFDYRYLWIWKWTWIWQINGCGCIQMLHYYIKFNEQERKIQNFHCFRSILEIWNPDSVKNCFIYIFPIYCKHYIALSVPLEMVHWFLVLSLLVQLSLRTGNALPMSDSNLVYQNVPATVSDDDRFVVIKLTGIYILRLNGK